MLIDKLASSVGADKATAAVSRCCAELRVTYEDWSHDEALRVLERLAEDEGVIGTVARFAKVRVILAGPPPPGLGLPSSSRRR